MKDEEVAYRIVEIYVREISQRGEKRKMGLDTIINAYFYALARLKRKDQELAVFEQAAVKEETEIEQIEFPETPAEDQFKF